MPDVVCMNFFITSSNSYIDIQQTLSAKYLTMNKTLLKKTSLCIFFSCIVTLVSAQITIQGKILNAETKQPVENASVYFNNTQIGATSDEKGQFKL